MEYFDLDTEISIFPHQSSKEYADTISISDALDDILSGKYREIVGKYRKTGDDDIKRRKIPSVAFHGQFVGSREKKNFKNPTGIVIVDIDDVPSEKLQSIKEDIILENDSVLASFISPSGNGLKCLYLVDTLLVTVDNYRKIGSEVSRKFAKYGKIDVLSITDCVIMSYDPELMINEGAIPDTYLVIEEYVKTDKTDNLSDRDTSIELFNDPEDFFEKVLLDQIENKADNNYHFIQMSVFELAKFGFKPKDYDLSFVVDYSENTFKRSRDNNTRFKESCEEAEDIQQTRWAYDYSSSEKRGTGSMYDDSDCDYGDVSDEPDNDGSEKEGVIDGLIDYGNFYDRICSLIDEGDRIGEETSLKNLNDIFRFSFGLLTITGIPTHGKTEFIDQIVIDLARLAGWKTCVAGFEQREEEHAVKLMRKLLGFNISSSDSDRGEQTSAYDFAVDHIKHVDIGRTGGDIKKILKIFSRCVEVLGTKMFVLDPFNLLTIRSKSGGHEKINEILREIVLFCKEYNVAVILVAHPYKMKKDEKTGKFEVPDFYSVKGSSAFYEMSYHGLTVYRDDDSSTPVMVKVLKVKQNNLGKLGAKAYFRYHSPSGRYIPIDKEGNELDSDRKERNWHKKAKKLGN